MKKVLVVLAMISAGAFANVEKNQAMYDMMRTMMKNSPKSDMSESAKCLGVSKSKLESILDQAMESCFSQHKNKAFDAFMASMETCIEPQMQKESGFSQTKIDACRSDEDKAQDQLMVLEDKAESLRQKIDQLYQNGAPDSQIFPLEDKLARLEEQMDRLEFGETSLPDHPTDMQAHMATQQAEMANMMQMMSKASEKSLHLITLPIFKPSQVMMHMIDGGQMQIGDHEDSLPAATFAAKASPEKVLAFYRSALPKFHYKNLGNGEHILMESMPKDFNMLKHMQLYISTPHILIRPVRQGGMMGAPEGSLTNIEIAYREK